jgi:hypothetical protein
MTDNVYGFGEIDEGGFQEHSKVSNTILAALGSSL